MYSHKNWTPEQISKMNEEKFLVEMLDMFRFSPSNDDNSAVEQMRKLIRSPGSRSGCLLFLSPPLHLAPSHCQHLS
jgi:hypothetical protein